MHIGESPNIYGVNGRWTIVPRDYRSSVDLNEGNCDTWISPISGTPSDFD